ncbi:hypothetical protein ABC855_g3706 [[Candida] zeylanoides]
MVKRQRISSSSQPQTVTPTVYEVPQESLINFPSSIVNGVTKEKGLVSLTLKSVTCAKLVEESTWLHDLFFGFRPPQSRIIEEEPNLKEWVLRLQNEVEDLKHKTHNAAGTDAVDQVRESLETSLSRVEEFNQVGDCLVEQYEREHPNTKLKVRGSELYDKVAADFDIKVDRKPDGDDELDAVLDLETASVQDSSALDEASGAVPGLPEEVLQTTSQSKPLDDFVSEVFDEDTSAAADPVI